MHIACNFDLNHLAQDIGTCVMASTQIPEPLQCKTVFNRYLSNGRSNPKNSKNEVHFISNFASGRSLPTQSTGPQPIQLVPKNLFSQKSQYRSLKSKKSKNKVHLFLNFASGRTLPTQSTGPQPIQLVPKHCFFYRYLGIGRSNKKN